MTGSPERPCHLIDHVGDRWARCGADTRTNPYGWARHLEAWREGHARSGNPLHICTHCLAQEEGENMATDNLGPIEWREPPEKVGLPRGRGSIWAERLRPLIAQPGTWAMVRAADTPQKANGTVSTLRKSKMLPPGKWEFRAANGEVFAKYVGPE